MGERGDSVRTSVKLGKREVVGVIPAAGRSRRLGLLPCSKEIFPVGFSAERGNAPSRPKVAAEYLLDKLRAANVPKAYIVIREGKWDIPAYFGDGRNVGMDLAYLVIPDSCGPPDSVDRAYPFIRDQIVAFGFPDILLEPTDIFGPLLGQLRKGGCDIVLGLFPVIDDCRAMDMVEYDAHSRVKAVFLKPDTTHLRFAWACAVWTPVFTRFLHEFLRSDDMKREVGLGGERRLDAQGDVPVGAVIKSAVEHGMHVECVPFSDGSYIDIGTPKDLARAARGYR